MKVLLTGGTGMLGQALQRLAPTAHETVQIFAPPRSDLPLADQKAVAEWFSDNPVDAVIHAAARVGGIQANINHPVEFLVENLRINDAVIMGAHQAGVERLIFLGSSCMYPKDYRQPLQEQDVLAAPLESTNEGYALSKITGSKLCDYISQTNENRHYKTLIPCNLFGTEDHFGSVASHLIAAIVTKVVQARENNETSVEIWGSGKARREFLFVDDLVHFILGSLGRLSDFPNVLNIGYGTDHSVTEYYEMVADIAGYSGSFHHDLSKPEGMMQKCMTSQKAFDFGWRPKTSIEDALAAVIKAYEQQLP